MSVCIVTIDIGTDSCFCVFNVLHTAWGVLYFAATAPGKRRFCSRRTYQSCPSSHQLFQASASSLLLLMSIFLNYMLNVFVYTLYIHYTYVCIYIYISTVDEPTCALMCVVCSIDRLHRFCGYLPDSLKVIGPGSS